MSEMYDFNSFILDGEVEKTQVLGGRNQIIHGRHENSQQSEGKCAPVLRFTACPAVLIEFDELIMRDKTPELVRAHVGGRQFNCVH